MSKAIRISFESVGEVIVELKENWNPRIVNELIRTLPKISTAYRWGDEIYFEIGVETAEENSRVDMNVGEVAYWPQGKALCIFFGPTPVSTNDKPKAYSPVNPVGLVKEEIEVLRRIRGGEKVLVEIYK